MIAWCLIVEAGIDSSASLLDNCLASLKGHVDGIFIQLNAPKGKSISQKVRQVAEKYTKEIMVTEWTGNFVKARKQNFAQVPKKYDFIGWCDVDDTFEHPEKIREVATIIPKDTHGVYVKYDYDIDEHGNVLVAHWNCRMVRNDGSFEWKSSIDDSEFSVHETLVPKRSVKQASNDEFKIIHHADNAKRDQSLNRNIELLEKMYAHQKDSRVDPRILFYLATHYYDAGRFYECKNLLIQYLQTSGWAEERSEAHVFMGRIFNMDKDSGAAKRAFLLALGENVDNQTAYLELAKLDASEERHKQAVRWIKTALAIKQGPQAMVLFSGFYDLYMLYAECLTQLGGKGLSEALKMADKAVKLRPFDPQAIEKRDEIDNLVNYQKDMKAVARLVRQVKDDKPRLKGLLDNLPKDLSDSPVVIGARQNLKESKKWPKKSIAIYCGNGPLGIWGPWSLEKGIGGSEEAVIRLSNELAEIGWQVTIYATPGEKAGTYTISSGGITGTIEWKQYWEFNPDDEFDVVVAWRMPSFFDIDIKARKKYLWLHDVMEKEEFTDERLERIDKVIVLSEYHKSLFPMLPPEKMFLSANGVTAQDFEAEDNLHVRDPHRIIYMSSHIRGLALLYDIWDDVKKAVPDAKLDIYYGWESYVQMNHNNPGNQPGGMAWMRMMRAWESKLEGVTDRGKIGQKEIVQEIFKSGVWAYPCVTGDTLIDMPRNYQQYPLGVPIRKLVGKKNFPVWSHNVETGAFELKNVNWVALTRKKAKIIKINWTDGTSLRCTPDHKIYTYKRGWVEAKDLQADESVVALKKHMMVQVSTGQGKWPYEHRAIAEYTLGKIPKGYHVDHEDGNCFNNEPGNLQILSPSDHAAKTYKEQYSTRPLIERRKATLAKYRATEKGKKQLSEIGRKRSQSFWDNLSLEDRKTFVEKRAKNVVKANKERIENMTLEERSLVGAKGRESRWNHKVESIEDAGYEDVYDMNVDDNHNFIAGGVVVHNCPFPEIYCITALKAQAGGAIPVSSDFAALNETVQFGEKIHMVQKDEDQPVGSWDKAEVESYKKALIDALKHPEKYDRQEMMSWARGQSWKKVAQDWSGEMI